MESWSFPPYIQGWKWVVMNSAPDSSRLETERFKRLLADEESRHKVCPSYSAFIPPLDAAAAISHFLKGGVAGEHVVRRFLEVTKGAAPGTEQRIVPAS
jgi:hypothetical protein